GKKKKDLYWNVCIVLGIIAIIAIIVSENQDGGQARGEYVKNSAGDSMYECADGERIFDPEESLEKNGIENCIDGSDEVNNGPGVADICGGLMCCCSLIFAISALSTKNDTQRVVVVQQQPQYVPVVQQVIQQPRVVAKPNPPATPIKNQQMWLAEAKNLELARNWEAAADAYQKAGMYEQAGKIRQEHLEQKQPVVQIGHVGNTVLNDSVMISDNSQLTCKSCGSNVEPTWKICPHCSNPL
ncbi:MAG: hypothetical protein CMA19_06240, partial [Euryarchaeota archaeon]|nr:hypothetical protein [Euryarchaeota archaeon]